MALTYKEIAEILKIIDASDAQELVLEIGGTRLAVRKGHGPTAAGGTLASARPAGIGEQGAGTPISAPVRGQDSGKGSLAPALPAEDRGVGVRAPMVGTFYRRPAPDQPPFVEIGQSVAAGTPMCLIEVMKLYTTIEAPVTGRVLHIAAEDGALVEFDQLLFSIEP
jgi:acetyl-CoA carboxylase biotin carboxyl carrier protein